MKKFTHSGTNDIGVDWEIVVTQGATFHAYDVAGWVAEVVVDGGAISYTGVPEELNAEQARALAAMLKEAAEVLDNSIMASAEGVAMIGGGYV